MCIYVCMNVCMYVTYVEKKNKNINFYEGGIYSMRIRILFYHRQTLRRSPALSHPIPLQSTHTSF